MEITEPISILNKRLIDFYGKFEDGQANFRIVFSDDQIEKQLTEFTESGLELPYKQLREVKKYPWIHGKYVLERLMPVPETNLNDLTVKLSYEPIWVYEDNKGWPLPPVWSVTKIILDTLLEGMNKPLAPEKMAEEDMNTTEALEEKAKQLESALFGNETDISDALATGSAVGYGNYRRDDSRFNQNPIKVH